ncbi:single-strand selective monofunctional uracil DNA glycosylase [Galendromus occidentalis]|uniref:Single-strand selective monofunctional uracil DNA glycosylase n=1 Tax=Galendromus occidentalis TaxID=34638 RepID=A0AAJ7SGD6_9ACAR|nr:single-strand selective monofunctional uracil DNA glycosylase [Galendromus occidentalis]
MDALDEQQRAANDLAEKLFEIEVNLGNQLMEIAYDDRVKYIYNPLDYAAETHRDFVRAALGVIKPRTGIKILFIGINPGPYGMAQNGVPFGDTDFVRDWLEVRGIIRKPYREHPKRPVEGFKCKQREMSGKRFWSLIKDLCGGKSELFYECCIVYNFCPLSFMEDSARNITPDQLRGEAKKRLLEACDEALRKVVELLQPEMIVGVGKFAYARAAAASEWLTSHNSQAGAVRVFDIPHPSPASPEANQGWDKLALHKFDQEGLLKLTGWTVSDDRLQEAAKESERIIQAKNNRSPAKRRRTVDGVSSDGSPSPEKRKSRKAQSVEDSRRNCPSVPGGTQFTTPENSVERYFEAGYPSYAVTAPSIPPPTWPSQWSNSPQVPSGFPNSKPPQWNPSSQFMLQSPPQWSGAPWPGTPAPAHSGQYDYYAARSLYQQPAHQGLAQPSQILPPSPTLSPWGSNVPLAAQNSTPWPLSSFQH